MLVQLLTLKDQELLEPPDLGVALGCGSNNSVVLTTVLIGGNTLKVLGDVQPAHGLTL